MRIAMPYDESAQEAALDWARNLGVLDVTDVPPVSGVTRAAREAFRRPIGMQHAAFDGIRPGAEVVIVVSDSFRKTRIHEILPAMLEELEQAGARERDISFLYSTGSHRPPTGDEQRAILGEAVYDRFQGRAYAHDPADKENLVFLGRTSRGTPVSLNRRLVEADHVIVTGTVVLHYFGGFGGGRKSLVPGLAGLDTIAHNHALNLHPTENRLNPDVRIGVLEGNPVAEDMLEGARLCRVDCIVNTVLNRAGAIAWLYVGELDAAFRAAARFARDLYAVPIEERADLVIASAGSARNFVQCHKALFNAYQAVKPGGHIVFLAAAPEGFGGNKFAQWLRLGSRDAIIAELRKNAEINGQTALSTLEKAAATTFVTRLSDEEVRWMGGRKAATLAEALEQVRADLANAGVDSPACYLMPSAAYTVPWPHLRADV